MLQISDSPLQDWVRWDSGSSVTAYSRRMSTGGWGGGIEVCLSLPPQYLPSTNTAISLKMAACCNLKGVTVEVFEKKSSGYKRISAFVPAAGASRRTIRVLYQGGVHYDAIAA